MFKSFGEIKRKSSKRSEVILKLKVQQVFNLTFETLFWLDVSIMKILKGFDFDSRLLFKFDDTDSYVKLGQNSRLSKCNNTVRNSKNFLGMTSLLQNVLTY